MEKLKLFEKFKSIGLVGVIEMISGLPEIVTFFDNRESANNYIVNIIHTYEKNKLGRGSHYGCEKRKGSHYDCENMFDVTKLLEYWNEKYSDSGCEIYLLDIDEIRNNVELDPELKIRKEAQKYNL